MIRSLFIVAGASLVLAIVCLAGAAAIGGHEVTRNGWRISGDGWDLANGDFRRESLDRTVVTRDIAWEGGEALTFDLPARVIYAQGDQPSITVAGSAEIVDSVTFADGRFDLQDGVRTDRRSRPRITVVAPAVTRFTLNGSQDLEIRDYDQPTLALAVSGSGDVEGYGRTGTLTVTIDGSGDVNLSGLPSTDAVIEINGSGDVEAAPSGQADVTIRGSGDVDLITRPARLNSQVMGSGRVRQAD
ncbi:MAG: GIN domain-containing protein [Brevundimonas sp.]|uniref:GIN domain-containing protein n=1 Tax=Brevundimonas sp. TaxID=1871086 RepID=UPI00391DA958